MPIRVAVIYGGGSQGGAPRYLETILKGLDRGRFQVLYLDIRGEALTGRIRDLGWETRVVPAGRRDPAGRKLARAVAQFRPHLINTHGVRANFFGRLVGSRLGIPVVTTVHSVLAHDYGNAWRRLAAELMERATQKRTRRFIAISQSIARYLEQRGVAPEKIQIIYHGLEVEEYRRRAGVGAKMGAGEGARNEAGEGHAIGQTGQTPGDRAGVAATEEVAGAGHKAQTRLGYPGKPVPGPVIGTVARLHPVKGLGYLILAFAEVLRAFPQAHLIIIGGGGSGVEALEEARLRRQVEELGLGGAVTFAGYRNDVPRWLAGMDVFVLPSLMEGLGLVLLEAMALEKPVVATRVGGIPEIVEDEKSGLLVPPADAGALATAIRRVLADPRLARRLGQAGYRRVVAQFSAQRMLAETQALFSEVAGYNTRDA